MIRYEREQLWKWWEIIWGILEKFKAWLVSWWWNLNAKKIWFIAMFIPILLSVAYLYMWIQNAFTPYSTAWDANHEYMYIPKILAENAGVYWWNTVASSMPWFWHQFLAFVFSLTGCTNWWFGLSPDNIAISMNNISATLVLIFWIAIIFQIFALINNKKEAVQEDESQLKKWKNTITEYNVENSRWITMWRYMLLLWLTGWMWAFLVIVDNKTDLWVMALSLLALLAWLIFLQNRKSNDKKEVLKYVLIAWLFFWFATLAKITAFVDLVLFWLLLVWLRFSPLTSLWIWAMAMGLVRKFNILTSSVMLTREEATWFIIVWWIIAVLWLGIHLSTNSNAKNFRKNFTDLVILWIWFLIPLFLFKLSWVTIGQIKADSYSISGSLRAVFLSMDTKSEDINKKYLAQNTTAEDIKLDSEISDSDIINSLDAQDEVDNSILNSRNDKTFKQCSSAGNIYSDKELSENLQELIGWWGWEDLWRYIWYWWKDFKQNNLFSVSEDVANNTWFKIFKSMWPKSDKCDGFVETGNIICEKNLTYWLLKLIWPTNETCYGLNYDAKVLCNNANVIDSFKIDDLRWIYENWIKDKQWEAGLLLKQAIDAYDKAKSEWRLSFWTNTTVFHDEIVNLRQYYQSHSISSTDTSVNIPYRYIVPLNISFNWSLQNLSSYYTDTWFFRIIVYVFLLIALPYAIVKKDKILTSVTLTTLIWWWIRWIIWSAILWYGTVLISWTMITLAIFWNKLLHKDEEVSPKIITVILTVLVWLVFWIQIIFNFLRIASQWASSVFVRYKWNVGNEQVIDDDLKLLDNPRIKYWYTAKNIFNLQFPQYNPIINALADRSNEDWIIIAWTYIQYFLWNQWNIRPDGMLQEFWKNTSDWDLCKTYWRMKNNNTRYLIIDPNIWTVSMWEWNETLFYRFFWKINVDNSGLEIDWTITTLIRLAQNGYLKLLSTNNLWAKYAFIIDDDIIRHYFGEDLTDEWLILSRWKMAVLQYFDDANSLFWYLAWIFLSRILNDTKSWLEDIANIYWIEIDSDKVTNAAYVYLNAQTNNDIKWFVKDLSQDERTVLTTYLNIYLWYMQYWESWIASMVQSLLLNSVSGWSQIIALELN